MSTPVQPVVRLKAEALGARGRAWLAGLPDVLAELARRWDLTVGESMSGGTSSYVARCHRGAEPAVLKVCVPDQGFAGEAGALVRAEGRGYVRLLEHDEVHEALLLESLGRSLTASGHPPESQLDTIGALLAQAWRTPPGEGAVPHDKAAGLADLVARLWDELDHPCPRRVVEQALDFAARRSAAFEPARCVLVHGDAATANVLSVLRPRAGAEHGYVFVDPDSFVGDPAYDAGVALRDWCAELSVSNDPVALVRRWCGRLATQTGRAEDEVWEWAYLERVSTGLFAQSFGAYEQGTPFLESAERLL